MFDIAGALLILFITIPLMLVVFLVLLISTGRPVFFKTNPYRTGSSPLCYLEATDNDYTSSSSEYAYYVCRRNSG